MVMKAYLIVLDGIFFFLFLAFISSVSKETIKNIDIFEVDDEVEIRTTCCRLST